MYFLINSNIFKVYGSIFAHFEAIITEFCNVCLVEKQGEIAVLCYFRCITRGNMGEFPLEIWMF